MRFPWSIKKKINTPAEQKIDEIKKILFPPLKLGEKYDEESNETIKYHIDFSVDSNLDAILLDIQEGFTGSDMQKTLNDVIKRLNKVRSLIEAYAILDKDAKYIIVDDMAEDYEDIHASED